MQQLLAEWGNLITRVCLSTLFLVSGFGMLMNFSGTVGFVSSIVPAAGLIVTILVILIKIGGGLAVLTGFKAKEGAWALIIFSAATILMVHYNLADQMQLIQALKNLAIIGGLLTIAMYGAGKKSWSPMNA